MSLSLADNDGPAYEYSRLSKPDEIRVLEIVPSKEQIECRVRSISYSDGGYYALSYVWGDESLPHRAAVVDGAGMQLGIVWLTQNLRDAICSLRELSELSIQSYWIDQICINQRDLEEKSRQVRMMGEIFSHASKVITYAGPSKSEEEDEHGMQLINRLAEHYPADHTIFNILYRAEGMYKAFLEIEKLEDQIGCLPKELAITRNDNEQTISRRYISQGWKWLLEIGFGEWTQRLWIVQVSSPCLIGSALFTELFSVK